ncbi:hypothetical protein J2X61_000609 [Bacillus sp. 3255]|nr:hypothetical protein [Bacillus sp. 3255]
MAVIIVFIVLACFLTLGLVVLIFLLVRHVRTSLACYLLVETFIYCGLIGGKYARRTLVDNSN